MGDVRARRDRGTSASRRRGPGSRLSVWHSLVAIALLPTLGMPLLAGLLAGERLQEARTARQIERDLTAVQALDRVRTALNAEVTAASLTLFADQLKVPMPALGSQIGMSIGSLAQTRAATDQLLAAVPEVPPLADQLTGVPSELSGLRQQMDQAIAAGDRGLPEMTTANLDYTHLADLVTAAEVRVTQAVASGQEGLPGARLLGQAHDLEAITGVVSSAGRRAGLFYLELLASPQLLPTVRAQLLAEDQRLRVLTSDLDGELSAAMARGWDRVRADPQVRSFDAALSSSQGAEQVELTLIRDGNLDPQRVAAVLPIATAAGHTMSLLSEFLAQGVASMATTAGADYAASRTRAIEALVVTGVLLALTGVALFLIGGTLRRRLQQLAEGAQRLSAGHLDLVPVHGPRELASAGLAINDAVTSLRHVEAKAELLASGDLDSPELERPAPGPLGLAVHASVTRIVTAVREREDLKLRLAHQASHDALTDLPNRAEIDRRLAAALARAQRSASAVSVLFIDLDRFKACNDRHGHAAGDVVLRTVAERLTGLMRAGDSVGRLGGDEFVVIVEGTPADSGLRGLGQRIVDALSEPIEFEGQLMRIGSSVGLASDTASRGDPDELLREADAAAYRAKANGGNTVVVYDRGIQVQLEARRDLEQGIGQALRREELVLHYQPLIGLTGNRLCGFEALIRWNRPGHGTLLPDSFIPGIEGSDLIIDMGRWALAEATRQLIEWSADPLLRDLDVAVNLSGWHVLNRGVVDDVRQVLQRSGLPPQRLVIEITESVPADHAQAIEHLNQLSALGVRIALDDFGSGHSSIARLLRLPIDIVKLDRSLITGSRPPATRSSRPITDMVIEMADRLDMTVIAEGIEFPDQLAGLPDQCDQAQGYLFSRPLPADQAHQWARANHNRIWALYPMSASDNLAPAPSSPGMAENSSAAESGTQTT